jgi:hypothetical protein
MTYATMWAYPWDFLDDGAETVARRLREDVGLDAVSLATSYHTVEHLRLHTRGRRTFQSFDAALYFRPDPNLWRGLALQPNVSPLTVDANPLERVCAVAERVGLKVESWTVCLHSSHLGRKHPDACERNVFGDPYPPHLCPSNPDVRAYATTLVRDLAANYPLYAVELESLHYGGFGHFHGHEKIGVELGHVGRFLLSLCFCESCRTGAKSAGVDVDAAASVARSTLERIFAQGAPVAEHVDDIIGDSPELAALLAWREKIVTSLTDEVKKSAGNAFLVAMLAGDPRFTGLNGKAVAEFADALELLCYTAQPEIVEQQVAQATTRYCAADDLIVGLSAFVPHTPSKGVLEANVRRAFRMGVRGFSFYNYGIMPERNLEWVASAVRWVREADRGAS